MTQVTKRALEEALKRLLFEKPLSKITIQDLADECMIWWSGRLLRMPMLFFKQNQELRVGRWLCSTFLR